MEKLHQSSPETKACDKFYSDQIPWVEEFNTFTIDTMWEMEWYHIQRKIRYWYEDEVHKVNEQSQEEM